MTIDKDAFAAGMGLLAGNFNRTLDGAVSRMYYRALGEKMTTAEFEAAVSRVIETETFWPSVATLLSSVGDDATANALSAFEHVNRVTNQAGGYRFLPFATYQREFDAPTKHAILAVGGLPAIANTSEERWTGLQKRFVAAYQRHGTPALPAPKESTDARVKQLVGTVVNRLSGRDRAAGEVEGVES